MTIARRWSCNAPATISAAEADVNAAKKSLEISQKTSVGILDEELSAAKAKLKLAEKVANDINIFAPAEIKKFATGKGNANKELMYKAFVDETGDDLAQLFEFDPYTGQSPVSDIIDSYYIAKYQHSNS